MNTLWRRARNLTQTEKQIILLIGNGCPGPEAIAQRSGRSLNTIKTHLRHIYTALEVSTILQVAIPMYWKMLMACNESLAPPKKFLASELSPREREVAYLVAEGCRNREIVLRLNIAEDTVKHHLFTIFFKLGISHRTELAFRVLREYFFLYYYTSRSPHPS
jgi:DNA-binding NarL/FixJ family response regulator